MSKRLSEMWAVKVCVVMVTFAFAVALALSAKGEIQIRPDGSVEPATAPVSRDGDTYSLTDNIFEGIVIQRSGTTLDGAGHTVQGSGTGWGVFAKQVSGVTIRGLTIKGFENGIGHFSRCYAGNLISGNNISDNNIGILLGWHANDVMVTQNTLSGNSSHGIYLIYQCFRNTIADNTISANGGHGIFYQSVCGHGAISGNTISGNAGTGIYFDHSGVTAITNNTISDNGGDGFTTWGLGGREGNVITYNLIEGNGRNGITGGMGYSIIAGNTVSDNGSDGISLWSGASHNAVQSNTCTDNGAYGIRLAYNSIDNGVHHNNLVNNNNSGVQAYDDSDMWGVGRNYWDTGAQGNCWSDYPSRYPSATNDGYLWDTPYVIDGSGEPVDRYPLVGQTFSMTGSDLVETSSTESSVEETLLVQRTLMNAAVVTGDLNGTLDFTSLDLVSIQSGPFAGKGFSSGQWQANLEGADYAGQWHGVFFLQPAERRINLNGAILGGLSGIVEGELTESIPGSGIYDHYHATWRFNYLGIQTFSATVDLHGMVVYQGSSEYPSTPLHVLQASFEGVAAGHYSGPLSIVLTHVRVASGGYSGQGFSIMSYVHESGQGEGWAFAKIAGPGVVKLRGLSTEPLTGILSGTLVETGPSKSLSPVIDRVDVGLPPAPHLRVLTWGPGRVSPGQTIDYLIEVRNDGVKPAEDVTVVNKIPWQVDYVSNTGGGSYGEASRDVAWHFDSLGAKCKEYLTTRAEVEWGLPGHSFFDNIVVIPREEIEMEVDPTVSASYEVLEMNEDSLEATGTISNEFYSESFQVTVTATAVPEATEPVFELVETAEEMEVTVEVTIEGHSPDRLMRVGLKYGKRAKDLYDVSVDVFGFYKAALERRAFLDSLRQSDLLSQPRYEKWVEYNAWGGFFVSCVVSGVGKMVPVPYWESYLTQLLEKSQVGLDAMIGKDVAERIGYHLPPEYEDMCREALHLYREMLQEYLNTTSHDVDSHEVEVITAHDPNIKYGPEGSVVPDQTLDYRVEYENEGKGIAFGVYFTDVLDEDLVDTTLVIGPVIDVATGSQIAPPGIYSPESRTITWFAGEVGPGEGGYAEFSAKVRSDAPHGTEVIDFATVYFPSVPEVTRTNGIVSIVRLNEPPTAEAGGPYVGDEGSPITFDASGSSDADDDELRHRWDFDNDGSWDNDYSPDPTAPHTWPDYYSGEVVVEVYDGEYTDTDTAAVTVNNVAPTASIESIEGPTAAFVLPDDVLTFTGSFTDPGVLDIHTVEWEFGDGGSADGLSVTHGYSSAGEYTVTLTVMDDNGGMGKDTRTVTVSTPQEAAGIMNGYIQDLPDGAFDENPPERKNALANKFNALNYQLDSSAYQGAIGILSYDIRPKVDGGRGRGDWITDPDAQRDLCAMIDGLIAYLKTLP